MREDLVGYLLGALEEPESARVQAALADPRQAATLQRDLDLLRQAVAPLARDRAPEPPPAGLAGRTLAFVHSHAAEAPRPMLSPADDSPVIKFTIPKR